MSDQTTLFGDASQDGKPLTLSPVHYRAIRLYAEAHNCKLTLNAPPLLYFMDSDGNLFHVTREQVVEEYRTDQKERARERAQQRAIQKRRGF